MKTEQHFIKQILTVFARRGVKRTDFIPNKQIFAVLFSRTKIYFVITRKKS